MEVPFDERSAQPGPFSTRLRPSDMSLVPVCSPQVSNGRVVPSPRAPGFGQRSYGIVRHLRSLRRLADAYDPRETGRCRTVRPYWSLDHRPLCNGRPRIVPASCAHGDRSDHPRPFATGSCATVEPLWANYPGQVEVCGARCQPLLGCGSRTKSGTTPFVMQGDSSGARDGPGPWAGVPQRGAEVTVARSGPRVTDGVLHMCTRALQASSGVGIRLRRTPPGREFPVGRLPATFPRRRTGPTGRRSPASRPSPLCLAQQHQMHRGMPPPVPACQPNGPSFEFVSGSHVCKPRT